MDRDWLDEQRAWRRRAWRLGKILKRARKDLSAKPCRNALPACRCSCYDLLIWNMRLHRTRQRSSDATDPVFISLTVSASASAIRSTNAPLIRLLAQPSRSRPRPARPLRGPHGVAFSMGRPVLDICDAPSMPLACSKFTLRCPPGCGPDTHGVTGCGRCSPACELYAYMCGVFGFHPSPASTSVSWMPIYS